MTKRNNYTLADFIIGQMKDSGFEVTDMTGAPGREIVTFKNAKCETRTVECGFSYADRPTKNIRVYFIAN